jgi:hypothetical protein
MTIFMCVGTSLNGGSSSLKFGLYRVESSIPKVLLSGEAESIGSLVVSNSGVSGETGKGTDFIVTTR